MPALSAARREEIRSRILQGARGLFVQQGFHGTSTRDLARAAGLSVGGLYVHFPGKEELFAAVVDDYKRLFDGPDNPLQGYLERTRFPDDLPQMAAAMQECILRHREFWMLWYVDVLEFGGRHFAGRLLADPGTTHPAVRARLAELKEQQRLRIDPALAFRMVYMHLFNFLIVEILFGGRDHYGVPAARAVAEIEDVFLRGILR